MTVILQFILGSIGNGKTTYCIEEAYKRKNKKLKSLIITPDQFVLESEKKIIKYTKERGILDIEVLGFNRLAQRIIATSSLSNKTILDSTTKIMLIKKIIIENENRLQYYSNSADKQGFIEKISNIIKEFYENDVTEKKIARTIKELVKEKNNNVLLKKIEDINLIIRCYKEFLEENYIDEDNLLNVLNKIIKEDETLKNTRVFIDGFINCNRSQIKIIGNLLNICEKVVITLPLSKVQIENTITKLDPYYEPKKMYMEIMKLAHENEVNIDTEIVLENKTKYSKEIDHIRANYLKVNHIEEFNFNENIKIIEEEDKFEEAKAIGREVIYLVKNEGYRFKDIVIITGEITEYETVIKSVFKNYNIPIFVDTKKPLHVHPSVEIILGILDVCISNYSYESIFRILKTGILDFTEEEVNILETYVLATGMTGYKWGFDEWTFELKNERFDLEVINDLKNRFRNGIVPFTSKFTYKTKSTVKEFSTYIIEVLKNLKVGERVLALSNEENNYDKIWKQLMEVLNKTVEVLGGSEVTTIEYKKLLESGFLSANVGIIPAGQDEIILGNISRTQIDVKKCLIVLGCNFGNIPLVNKDDTLLIDRDIDTINKTGYEILNNSKTKVLGQNLLLYRMLLKSSKNIILTYSRNTVAGKELLASELVLKIQKMFNIKINENKVLANDENLDLLNIIIKLKDNIELSTKEKNLINYYERNEHNKNLLNIIKKSSALHKKREVLSPEIVNKIYSDEIASSVTKLEKYALCPFAYFMKYNLNVDERKIYEVRHLEFGNVLHNILDDFITQMNVLGNVYGDVTKEYISEFTKDHMEKIIKENKHNVFNDNEKNKYLLSRISRIAKRSIWALVAHINSGEFIPYKSEFSFSRNQSLKGIEFDLGDNKKIIISGKVDRIDILKTDGEKYFKIIDYKLSAKKIDLKDVYKGVELQLITYLNILIENVEGINVDIKNQNKAGGVFYFTLQDPLLSSDKLGSEIINALKSEDAGIVEGEVDKEILKEFKMTGLVNEDKEIIKHIDNSGNKKSDIIPIAFKKDGEISAVSRRNALSNEEFDLLRNHCTKKIVEIGKKMTNGDISISPLKRDTKTSCDFCLYKGICLIDIVDENKRYTSIEKLSKEEIFKRILEEQ